MFAQPFFIPAVIFLLISLPLIFGLIPPNRFYGVRTRETFANPEVWYRTNRVAGGAFVVSSLLYLLVAAFFPSNVAGQTDFGRWLVHLLVFAGSLVVSFAFVRSTIRR